MDSLTALQFARELIDIDSTTGQEGEAGRWLAGSLRARGYTVVEQAVDATRFNVLATLETPEVLLSTHFDCVPPFIASSVSEGSLFGRGACDAKGILAAQVAAAERLRTQGHCRVGLLFVVGEERGSDGAAAANTATRPAKFLVNGEPTDSRLATGTRGVLRLRFRATGRAGHSSAPEHFESAIEKLVDAIVALRRMTFPSDPEFGTTSYSVGLIEGGVAPNVVPANASAEVMFRTVGPADDLLRIVSGLAPLVHVEEVLRVPHVRLRTLPGFVTASFPFTTDIPLLDRLGLPLLFGPGSFLVAHTDREHLSLAEFHASIDAYVRIVSELTAKS
jgi:acetylornithine deacetylase